jgi:hypothetical protein
MDDRGNIREFPTDEEAKKAGFKTKLSQDEAKHLLGFNRHERRAELSRMRKAARKAKR